MIAMGWQVGVLGTAFAVGCSSNPSISGPTDSGPSDLPAVGSFSDSGPSDVQSVGSPSDGGPSDVQVVGSPSDSGAGCYTLTGSASTEECAFSSCALSGSSCAALRGSAFGSCQSSGLYGCCIQTQTRVVDGGGTGNCLQGTCYYSLDAGRIPESKCEADMYLGLPYMWDLTSP
jgi:hypothetical protein